MKPKKITYKEAVTINEGQENDFINGYAIAWNKCIEAMEQHKAEKKGKNSESPTIQDCLNQVMKDYGDLQKRIKALENSSVKFDERIVLEDVTGLGRAYTIQKIVG